MIHFFFLPLNQKKKRCFKKKMSKRVVIQLVNSIHEGFQKVKRFQAKCIKDNYMFWKSSLLEPSQQRNWRNWLLLLSIVLFIPGQLIQSTRWFLDEEHHLILQMSLLFLIVFWQPLLLHGWVDPQTQIQKRTIIRFVGGVLFIYVVINILVNHPPMFYSSLSWWGFSLFMAGEILLVCLYEALVSALMYWTYKRAKYIWLLTNELGTTTTNVLDPQFHYDLQDFKISRDEVERCIHDHFYVVVYPEENAKALRNLQRLSFNKQD